MWGQGRQTPRTTSEDQLHYDDDGDGDDDGGDRQFFPTSGEPVGNLRQFRFKLRKIWIDSFL